jgi:hypothetical protein
MKMKFIMMLVLIQSLKHPGNDTDVYLKLLIDDLLLFWKEEGVSVSDAHKQKYFNIRALLFVTIIDWSTLSNMYR